MCVPQLPSSNARAREQTPRRAQSYHHPLRPPSRCSECPTGAARFEHNAISAEVIDANLHRRARAQARVEEHQRDRFPGQRLRRDLSPMLELQRRVDQTVQLIT